MTSMPQPEDISTPNTRQLQHLQALVGAKRRYRHNMQSLLVPVGHQVVFLGSSHSCDKRWCSYHGKWENVSDADAGHPYWTYELLCRPEQDLQ